MVEDVMQPVVVFQADIMSFDLRDSQISELLLGLVPVGKQWIGMPACGCHNCGRGN
jgi:hypothetical protein